MPKDSAAPERSLTQRLDALEQANAVRTDRAKIKKDLKDGRTSIRTLLLEPPDCVLTAKVFDMLLAVPKYGRVKTNKILTQCRIAPSKTIGGLSERQRVELLRLLPDGPEPAVAHRGRSIVDSLAVASARHELHPEPAGDRLTRGLERLLEEARQLGRRAGRAAHEAGEELDSSAPRPDAAQLQAALARAVRAPTMKLSRPGRSRF